MILGFGHPAIVVTDLELMAEFYVKAFGFSPLNGGLENWDSNPTIDSAIGLENSAAKGLILAGHNSYLELFKFQRPKSTARPASELLASEQGIRHLCFYTDDLEADYNRLLRLGATSLGTPQKQQGITAVYLRDPEGNILELAEFPSKEENLINLNGIQSTQEHHIDV